MQLMAPFQMDNFLDLFDHVNSEGESYFHLVEYDEENPPTTEMLYDLASRYFETLGYGIFSFAQNIEHLKSKVNYDIIEENDKAYVIYNLAPFLGLPGENAQKELNELKEFLLFIKNELVQVAPTYTNQICLDRFEQIDHEENMTQQVEFRVITEAQHQEVINEKINSKIQQSAILTKWLSNQKKGITNTHMHCDNLLAHFSIYSLMNQEEKDIVNQFNKAQFKKESKEKLKLLKKRKF